MTHKGCLLDAPDTALAYGKVRGYRLVLANLNDDDHGSDAVLDEIEDCPGCLCGLVRFLASMSASLCESIAERAGAHHAAAVRRMEEMLDAAIRELPR